ncbi:hypothetical protein PSTT_16549 [Puccinia striiformis]|uniref:DUF6589 domain-containing protein n=1 Tax=Puccinia striiformis TaxID=27350 RepID=A0A2S4UCB2_9BASI|nr:hypothetical protein PSTT_16549 [Puccinia striiformis]
MAEPAPPTSKPCTRAPKVAKCEKNTSICALIQSLNWSTKDFMLAFLKDSKHQDVAISRRYWVTDQGWDSTKDLLLTTKRLAQRHIKGCEHWEAFILSQATEIVLSPKPPSGLSPGGSYYTTSSLASTFFSKDDRASRNEALISRMPFLYQLLCAKIQGNKSYEDSTITNAAAIKEEAEEDDAHDPSDEMEDLDGSILKKSSNPAIRRRVTERVSAYLNYIGISSSRRTAHAALKTLGTGAIEKIKARFKLTQSSIIAPFLCYNNLDFEEKVHMGSLSHDSRMFHGTWAYIHSASPSLLGKLDPAELTIDVLNNALHSGTKMTIRSSMFTSTVESTEHWGKALKSQIVWVILRYIAKPVDGRVKLDKSPPVVHPISPEDPNTNVLKLMIASDNSAAGVGEVFTGVIQQSGLTPEEFHLRLQIIEGNLASCNIFETLKRQRCPAVANHESLNNVFTVPGAAHTLWNVSQAIFLTH